MPSPDAVIASPASPAQGKTVTNGWVKFSGRSSAPVGSGITVTALDGALNANTCAATVRSDQTWSCNQWLADGGYTWTAQVNSGSPPSLPVDFVVFTSNIPAPLIDHTPSPTNDASPILTGTVSYNLTRGGFILEVSENGTVLCTVNPLTSTNWACPLAQALSEGRHTLTADVDCTTSCNNGSSPDSNPDSFVVKTRVATPTVDPIPSPTNLNQLPFSGTGEPGAVVTVAESGITLCQATVAANGRWSCTVAQPLGDGSHTVSATEQDQAGNTSGAATVTFIIDTHLPHAPTLNAPSTPTSDARVRFSGTGEPGDRVSVIDAYSRTVCSGDVDASGNWSCAPAVPLADGDYVLQAFQVTTVGNRSGPSQPVPLSVRTLIAPLFDVPPSPTRNPSPQLSGTAQAGTVVAVVVGETPICSTTAGADGRWTCQPAAPLADGSYLLLAQESDGQGHSSPPSAERDLVVDTTPPLPPVLDSPRSPTRKHRPQLSGTAEAASTVVVVDAASGATLCTATASASGAFSCMPGSSLAAGSYRISATATDAAGNVSRPATPVPVVISDAVPAPPTIDTPADRTMVEQRRPVISGRTVPGTSVQVSLDDVVYAAQVAPDGGWSLLPPAALAVGPHRLTATSTDAQQNVSDSVASSFTIIEGGVARGGCSSGGLPGPLFCVLAFVLWWRRRRAPGGALPALLAFVLPLAARAQAPQIDVSLFRPASGSDGYAAVEGARPPLPGEARLELRTWSDFAVHPLVFVTDSGQSRALVRSRAGEWLGMQTHLLGPLSLSAQVPLTLAENGDLSVLPPSSRGPSTLLGGFGDLRITPRLALLRQEWAGVDLAAQASLEVPTARAQSLSGDGRALGEGLVALGWRLREIAGGELEVLANGYLRLRPPRQFLDVKAGNEAGVRAGLGYLMPVSRAYLPRRVYAEMEGRSFLRAGFADGSAPAEWRVGTTLCPARNLSIDAAGGGGLSNGVGTPRARFLFGFGWSPAACGRSRPPTMAQVASVTLPPPVIAPLPAAPPAAPAAPPSLPVAQVLPLPPDRDGDGIPDAQDACPDQPGPADNHGCPTAIKQLVVISESKLEILDKVSFAVGKARIEKASYKLLDQVAAVLNSHPDLLLVQVEGHTDDSGSSAGNQLLSQRRAEAVAAYLVSKGVSPVRLRAKGFGPDRPLMSNATAEGRLANRRVGFKVVQTRSRVTEANRPPSS